MWDRTLTPKLIGVSMTRMFNCFSLYHPINYLSNNKKFPLYEFIKVYIKENNIRKWQVIGVMYSTYLHDYDRGNLQKSIFRKENITLTINLWNSLFEKSLINNFSPPLNNFQKSK